MAEMADHDASRAELFEAHRAHLHSVAYRMLGSRAEADDAVQEAWLRMTRADTSEVENLRGWLTTVIGRICLDHLRQRRARREEALGPQVPEEAGAHPDRDAELADSVGLALLVMLDQLAPAERVAFVLHDLFAVPFDEIAPLVNRSAAATRQLASRARRRVQGAPPASEAELARQRTVIESFLTALRGGDITGLLAVLDPDVRVAGAGQPGEPSREIRGAETWARGAVAYGHLARVVEVALIDGAYGLVIAPRGRVTRALTFITDGDKITSVEIIAEPSLLADLDVQLLPSGT
jgi:RNA polymerase sigma-70 factor (ECF subfamily)